jgi:Gpi18-like mannosyltransferase
MQENELKKVSRISVFVSLILLAVALRLLLFYIPNADLTFSLGPWYDTFIRNGRIEAFEEIFYDYAPAYMYFIDIATLFRFIPKEQAIKIISVFFDLFAAFAVYKIIALKYPQGIMKWIGFFILLFMPTVYIESSMWGQCDIVFTSFLLWSFYFVLKEKPLPAILFFSIALSFKLQAGFFAPIFVIIFLNKKFPFYLFITIPIVFFISIVPAWLAGGPLDKLITVYFSQFGSYKGLLSLNSPNIWIFIRPDPNYELKVLVGLVITGLVVLAYILFRWLKWKDMSDVSLCFDAVFFTTIIPFLLPKMHERYFFAAGLFLLVLAFFNQKLIWGALLMQVSSLISYIPFLAGWPVVYAQIGAVINLVLILGLVFSYQNHRSILKLTNEKFI